MSERAEKHAEGVRAEILHQAHDLFAHYGYWKTNIGDIAQCCGMSPGNLYRYFRNKQAIGIASVEKYFHMVETAMETAFLLPGETFEARIKQFLRTGVQHLADELERNPKIVELAEFICEDTEGIEVLARHIAWKRERLAVEIARGIEAGELKSCEAELVAATLLNALKAFWMPMTLADWRDKSTILPELDAILDLMFRGLQA